VKECLTVSGFDGPPVL